MVLILCIFILKEEWFHIVHSACIFLFSDVSQDILQIEIIVQILATIIQFVFKFFDMIVSFTQQIEASHSTEHVDVHTSECGYLFRVRSSSNRTLHSTTFASCTKLVLILWVIFISFILARSLLVELILIVSTFFNRVFIVIKQNIHDFNAGVELHVVPEENFTNSVQSECEPSDLSKPILESVDNSCVDRLIRIKPEPHFSKFRIVVIDVKGILGVRQCIVKILDMTF